MAINTLENQSHLSGTVMFLNAAVKTYLERATNSKRIDEPFVQLKKMMSQNLYLAELRKANCEQGEKYNQIDLVGIDEQGTPLCFTLSTNANLTMVDFKKEDSLQRLSEATRDILEDLKEKHLQETKDTIKPYASI